MKSVFILSFLALVAAFSFTTVCGKPADSYTTKYDNIDLDEILGNDRLYKKYYDCLTGDGKCTPDGKELKDIVPDALKTKCSKCNEKQKAGVEKVLKFIIDKKPSDWERLEKIYDPDGTFKKQYGKEAEEQYGIKL